MRVVLDTSVLVAAFRSPAGASYQILRFADEGRITMLTTTPLFLEYEEVLSRSEQRVVHRISLPELDLLLRGLALRMEAVELYFRWRPQLTDADHELVVEAAVNGRAACIVTQNIKDFTGIEEKFNVRILKPSQLLKEIRG